MQIAPGHLSSNLS